MSTRGNASYTEAPTISVGTRVDASVLKQLCDIIKINFQEYKGYLEVKDDNPTVPIIAVKTRLYTSGNESVLDSLKNSINAGNIIYANDFNQLISRANSLYTTITVGNNTGQVNIGALIQAATMNSICTSLKNISKWFDKYNSWWSSNNTCQRKCQTSCQYTCQLACQGCHNSNCHNQHCGT